MLYHKSNRLIEAHLRYLIIFLWYIFVIQCVFKRIGNTAEAVYSNISPCESWTPFIVTWKWIQFYTMAFKFFLAYVKQDDIKLRDLEFKGCQYTQLSAYQWLWCFSNGLTAWYALQHAIMLHRCLKRGSNIVKVHKIHFNMCLFQLQGKLGRHFLARITPNCSTDKKNGKYFK